MSIDAVDGAASAGATVADGDRGSLSILSRHFDDLVAPLFMVPRKAIPTRFWGHIPFLFVLFKVLRPTSYVELGVHFGGSFVGACTAAEAFGSGVRLHGVDTWLGDEHAGHYSGEQIYLGLRDYLAGAFPNASLIRRTFSEARVESEPESIDLLLIDGLHTYEAVRGDFETWLSAMSKSGVILFHDTAVFERDFGVHQLWAELKTRYATMEFAHSSGLGVLFLDAEDSRLRPLVELSRDPAALGFYRRLVERVGAAVRDQAASAPDRSLQSLLSEVAGRLVRKASRILARRS